MNNKQIISIDDAKFKKTSKKLHKHLLNFNSEIKLSDTQEILSQSLGYRNLYDLQKFINGLDSIENKNKESFLNEINSEQIIFFISLLIDGSQDGSIWKQRAVFLLSSIIPVIMYLKNENKIELNIETIRYYLDLDNIVMLNITNELPDEIKTYLSNYLSTIPGFTQSTLFSTSYEQHSYLTMQINPVLNLLEKVENNDFIIYSKQWKNNFEIIGKEINLNDSWMNMEGHLKIMNIKDEVKVSDLISYISSIISPEEQNKVLLVLKSLLNNYQVASKISEKIINIVNSQNNKRDY